MQQANGSVIAAVGPLAASGTKQVAITLPALCNKLVVNVAVYYAAVAGTTGVAVAFEQEADGAGSFSSSNVKGSTIVPAAATLGQATYVIDVTGATRQDPGALTAYQVGLTNDDATNAASFCVSYYAL